MFGPAPSPMRATRLIGIARLAILVAAVWVPAHDLVYLAAFGPAGRQHALEASGHGTPWLAAGFAALLGVTALAVLTVQRSNALRGRVKALGGVAVEPFRASRIAPRIGQLWLLVLGVSLALFLVQENLEHFALHAGHLPGLSVLVAGQYSATLPVFAALALAAATVGSLAIERLQTLADAVARAERAVRPARQLSRPPLLMPRRARYLHSTPDLGRAPPPLLAA